MDGEWVTVAKPDDVEDGGLIEVELDGRPVAIARVGDNFYALAGECPHQGGPMAQGELEGPILTCPWHNFRFDVRTGRTLDPPIGNCLKYELRQENGQLQLLNR